MNLAETLQRHEGKTLEFKRDLASPDKVLSTLIAFANTSGGLLVIGVENGTQCCEPSAVNRASRIVHRRAQDSALARLGAQSRSCTRRGVALRPLGHHPRAHLPHRRGGRREAGEQARTPRVAAQRL